MPGRLRKALRAGFVTLLLGFLCIAALATPALAAAPDFAHTHPHGTPQHLHPLNLVLGGTVPPTPVVSVSLTPYEGRTPSLSRPLTSRRRLPLPPAAARHPPKRPGNALFRRLGAL